MDDLHNEAIRREIRRLSLLIALSKHDYSHAVINKMPDHHRLSLADELCEYERQKKCLETKNFKALPYNVKLLYNYKR